MSSFLQDKAGLRKTFPPNMLQVLQQPSFCSTSLTLLSFTDECFSCSHTFLRAPSHCNTKSYTLAQQGGRLHKEQEHGPEMDPAAVSGYRYGIANRAGLEK